MPAENEHLNNELDDESLSWQAQKSAMTRDRILDATIDGFIKLGYSKLTTTKVASMAGVSRGAMRHHFASKKMLMLAAIEYLHKQLLEVYLGNLSCIPDTLKGRDLIRARVDAYWSYLNHDLFRVHQELCMMARTEPDLKDMLDDLLKQLDASGRNNAIELFNDFSGASKKLLFIIDITKFQLEGMLRKQFSMTVGDREELVERQLQYLTLCIEQVVKDKGDTELSKLYR